MADLSYSVSVNTARAQRNLASLNKNVGGLTRSFKIAGAAIGASLAAVSFKSMLSGILSTTQQMEKYRTVLTTFLGSQQKANAEIKRLQGLANQLPQDLNDVISAFTILTRNGLNTSSEALKNWSNVATANGKSMNQLAEAVADGLTGEFERFKEFGIKVSKESGKMVARIGDDVVATSNSAKTLVSQLQKLGATRFGGAAAANAGTLNQALSNLKGVIFETAATIGEKMKPELIKVVDSMANWIRANKEMAVSLGQDLARAIKLTADAAKLLLENLKPIVVAATILTSMKIANWALTIVASLRKLIPAAAAAEGAVAGVTFAVEGAATSTGLFAGALAFITGPIGIAVAAVAALTAGFIIYKDDAIKLGGVTTSLGEIFEAVFSKLWSITKDVWAALSEFFTGTAKDVGSFKDAMSSSILYVANIYKNIANLMIGYVRGVIVQWTQLPKAFKQIFLGGLKIVNEFVMNAGSLFREFWDYITSMGRDKIEFTFSGFSDVWKTEMDKLSATVVDWNEMLGTDYIGAAGDKLSEAIANTVVELRKEKQAVKDLADAKALAYKKDVAALKVAARWSTGGAGSGNAVDTAEKLKVLLEQQSAIYKESLSTYNKTNNEALAALEHQRDMIGLSDDQIEQQNTIQEFTTRYKESLAKLKTKLKELNKEPLKHAEEIKLVQKAITDLTAEYEAQLPAVQAITKEIQAKRLAVEAQLKAQEKIKQLAEETEEAIKDSNNFMYDLTESTADAQRAFDELDMSELEKSVNSIDRNINAKLKTEVDKLNKIKTPANAKAIEAQIAELNKAAAAAIKKQQELATESYKHQREFSYGWKKAFEEYKDNATNSAKQAADVFKTATSSMEDKLVDFVKTGKFEWKSLASTILEQLLRIQIQKTVANIGSAAGGLFAGMFANGGTIPSGKFGIVGEAGPEIVSGPANVTPAGDLGGGNITYNINAVDAASFKQMVSRDPSFIYAITEQGRKRQTGGR